jgi:UV DNA damage endonuclease
MRLPTLSSLGLSGPSQWGSRNEDLVLRLGLCCIFRDQSIKFFNTTATALGRMNRAEALAKLSRLCAVNAGALLAALRFCADHGIGCFRINSQILPIKTHPQHRYDLADLPGGDEIVRRFRECGEFARQSNLRTCFHPDQFVVLNSTRPDVVRAAIEELEYQAEVAEWVGADVINIHGGGAFGDKPKALARFARNLDRLSPRARSRLTIENDDRIYTPADLLPLCRAEELPFVYDVHHHRCNRDGISEDEATNLAIATWNREPLFHISSPIGGWDATGPQRHHDFIDVKDFPRSWLKLGVTVEVEAKAKELAVLKLKKELG